MDAAVLALVCVAVALAAVTLGLAAALVGQRRRVRALERTVERSQRAALEPRAVAIPSQLTPQQAEFVITDAGRPNRSATRDTVPDRLVLSATLGEPLVKVVAFAYGVRRGLSAENRNRILFQVRREVRRTRKERRREMRQAWREMKQQDTTL